jgi:arsenate reductase
VKKVIFACVHNAGRSQMAAAFFNAFADRSKATAVSAGTQPAEKIHDCVLEAMKQLKIDLSTVKPQLLTENLASDADFLITMGCGEACPYVPGLKREDWPFSDPKGKSIDEVYVIRDQIKDRVLTLLEELKAISHCESKA